MLTISRLTRWSIRYYNDTATTAKQAGLDRQAANGGVGEYYSEADTRVPTWLITGDRNAVAGLCGLDAAALAGGAVDTTVAAAWLDDGIAPNGQRGRAFTARSVHGFDLTFAAPKSVSLVRALTDEVAEKVLAAAHEKAIAAAMQYLHEHAGYTRIHNPVTGMKDLQRLPGLVGMAYQHETSRCGDPHLHTHVIVPNRQPRADGILVSIDSKSLYHEAKAAGMIYQATLRQILHVERGFEWAPVEPHSGMAEIAGITTDDITAWSQRSTRLREWARDNLVVVDGEPTAAQLAAAQKATRPTKPEALAWQELKADWHADARGLLLDRAAHFEARTKRIRTAHDVRAAQDWARLRAAAARIDKAGFTRADMVELIAAHLPVDTTGEPRLLTEAFVDRVGVRISAPRGAHEREGHEKFTLTEIMKEEEQILDLADDRDNTSRLDVRSTILDALWADQARAVMHIGTSPWLVAPLCAPAGAGKTHSLRALRTAAARAGKDVLVLAPTGKAVDEALHDDAGDRGYTIAKALHLMRQGDLMLDRHCVIVVDEASMVATPDLKTLLTEAAKARVKTVLVGDPYQLAPVKARGGMFEQLCDELPWTQRLSEVWRMRDPEERQASLALRSGHGNRLRHAIGWYRTHDRLHTGDPVAMASDALTGYLTDGEAGKDALLVCDAWEMADALNRRLHDTLTTDGPTASAARQQELRVGDLIVSRRNDATIDVRPGAGHRGVDRVDQVRNGNRWRVLAVDPATNRIAAERLTDIARAVFDNDYLREHVTLGYAVTVHTAQGVTTDTAHAVLADSATRAMAYVAMSRGRDTNQAYLYTRDTAEADHHHSATPAGGELHQLRRSTKYEAAHHLRSIIANDDRAHTMHLEAQQAGRELLPAAIQGVLDRHDQRLIARAEAWRQHAATARGFRAAGERMMSAPDRTGPDRRPQPRQRSRRARTISPIRRRSLASRLHLPLTKTHRMPPRWLVRTSLLVSRWDVRSPSAAAVMTWLGIRRAVIARAASLHGGEVVPEILKAVGAAEQGGEVCGVDEHDVACSLSSRWHPDQCVELGVAGFGERMGPAWVYPLTSEDLQFLAFRCGEFVVRQVGVEVEGGDVVEQSRGVEVAESGQRRDLCCPFDDRRSQAPLVVDGHVERAH
ncbi:MAG: ATP-dependent exoDNAse [Mycobacterium sp.]|nr:ATP-dependent exoDNAse [Mycobacterium sp.]